jgi:hypothetical protein
MSTNIEFSVSHEFHLLDGSVVYVMAELRGDWVAFESDGTSWYTVMGDMHPEWGCAARGVSRIRNVIKYGHRFRIASNGKSHRYTCECSLHGGWVRSIGVALAKGKGHHCDACLDSDEVPA